MQLLEAVFQNHLYIRLVGNSRMLFMYNPLNQCSS
jgi:hypothetical protein